ncbi:MAG: hypothetical protein L3J16_07870, partial [Anaerolineales bacterium]|nr:hypothetical protein [Anaerolineales bacterium]
MKFRYIILLALMTVLLSGCVSLAEDVTPPPNYVPPTPRPTAAPVWPETAPKAANGAAIFT